MFGVLVVILCCNYVAGLGFGTGKLHVSLIVSFRALIAHRRPAYGIYSLPPRLAAKRSRRPLPARIYETI